MIFPSKKTIFLLPPKCGTSSFVRLIKDNTSLFDDPLTTDIGRHSLLGVDNLKLKKNGENLQDYKFYQICRNPLNRLVSSFLFIDQQNEARKNRPPRKRIRNPKHFKRVRRPLEGLNFVDAMKLTLPLVSHYPTTTQIIKYRDTKFYKKYLKDHPHPFFKTAGFNYFQFYIPQYSWNNIDANVTYLKLEDLQKDNSILSEIFEENLPAFPTVNEGKPSLKKLPYVEYYNEEVKKLLTTVYWGDFTALGYDFP
jgi:hypothetical protein